MAPNSRQFNGEDGFLLPMALLLLVLASVLAVVMIQQSQQIRELELFSGLAQQSVYAAETGAQLASQQVLFPVIDRQTADSRCQALIINQQWSLPGLQQCQIEVSCGCRYENNNPCITGDGDNYNGSNGVTRSFYQIDSHATCGSLPYGGRHQMTLFREYP